MNISVIQYYGGQKDRCGYCKGTKCSASNGMHAYTMMPQDYQDLIDRGWRRSGMYCYKPNNKETCCPSYTIKCDIHDFKLSKSHKKVLKRMRRFLKDGKKDQTEMDEADKTSQRDDSDYDIGTVNEPQEPTANRGLVDLAAVALANPGVADRLAKEESHKKSTEERKPQQNNQKSATELQSVASSCSTTSGPRKKAKQIRLERFEAKMAAKGITAMPEKRQNAKGGEKSLADYLNETSDDDKHRLKIVLVPSKGHKVSEPALSLYSKYQLTVHNDKPERLTKTSLERFLYKTPLQLVWVPVKSKEFEHTKDMTFGLYTKYQRTIHRDMENTMEEYLDFLQRSPLKHTTPQDGPLMGYGSFHQQYWLDDKLIAVGVIDILPYCVSSVYFFYDPDYSFLSLGTYASLREIDFCRQLAETTPDLKYYYMGFYIHSCQKMRYKGKLSASYLLCPETYTWQPITEEIRQKLDEAKYQRFSKDSNERDANEFTDSDLNEVLLLLSNNSFVPYGHFIQSFHLKPLDNMVDKIKNTLYKKITGEDGDRECILEYGKLVGKEVAHRMLYYLDA